MPQRCWRRVQCAVCAVLCARRWCVLHVHVHYGHFGALTPACIALRARRRKHANESWAFSLRPVVPLTLAGGAVVRVACVLIILRGVATVGGEPPDERVSVPAERAFLHLDSE